MCLERFEGIHHDRNMSQMQELRLLRVMRNPCRVVTSSVRVEEGVGLTFRLMSWADWRAKNPSLN